MLAGVFTLFSLVSSLRSLIAFPTPEVVPGIEDISLRGRRPAKVISSCVNVSDDLLF